MHGTICAFYMHAKMHIYIYTQVCFHQCKHARIHLCLFHACKSVQCILASMQKCTYSSMHPSTNVCLDVYMHGLSCNDSSPKCHIPGALRATILKAFCHCVAGASVASVMLPGAHLAEARAQSALCTSHCWSRMFHHQPLVQSLFCSPQALLHTWS